MKTLIIFRIFYLLETGQLSLLSYRGKSERALGYSAPQESEREKMKTLGKLAAFVATLSIFATGALADNAGTEANNAELIKKLMKKIDQQEKRLADQEQRITSLQSKNAKASLDNIHAENLKDLMKEILQETKAKPATPKWMKNLKFFGDLRFRYEWARQCRNRSAYGAKGKADRQRLRYRLRFGFNKTWWEKQLKVQFRLSTSSGATKDRDYQAWGTNNGDPRSSNQTMTGAFSRKAIYIDQVYAQYKPNWAKGLTIIVGKMPVKPGLRTATDLTWETGVSPEGALADYLIPGLGDFKPYATIAWFSIQENSKDAQSNVRDSQLLFASAGFNWTIDKKMGLKWFAGASFYDFEHYDAFYPQYIAIKAGTNPTKENGWGGLSPKMRNIELTTAVQWKMMNLPWKAWGSFVRNCANGTQYAGLSGKSARNAWGIGLRIGKNKVKGDFSVQYAWKYIGANSVSHLTQAVFGGPNRKGHSLLATYNYEDNMTVRLGLWSTAPIRETTATEGDRNLITRVELLWKF